MSLSVHIEKKLGQFKLRIDLETENEVTALLGASGSGKSVTLKCIAGIMTPDVGRICLNGRTLFDREKNINLPPQERRVGYLFQQYALFPNMTVEQNICCGIRDGSREMKKQKTCEAIKRFHLLGLEKKYPAQLSGGQQQRVALARILLSEPDAILLDEPFSALDSYLKWDLELELSEILKNFQGPILWVSHDIDECYRNCSAACVVENGASGPVTGMEKLIQNPGTPSAARLIGCCNFLPARRCDHGVKVEGWNMLLPISAETEMIILAIPDHAISITGGEYTACVKRVIWDVGGGIVLLQSIHDELAPMIRTKITRDEVPKEGTIVAFGLDADRCLCYPDE